MSEQLSNSHSPIKCEWKGFIFPMCCRVPTKIILSQYLLINNSFLALIE